MVHATKTARAACIAAGLVLVFSAEGRARDVKIDFEDSTPGSPPTGFSTAVTHGGEPGRFVVEEDEGDRVVVQRSADRTNGRFPLCVFDGFSASDVAVSVRVKPISGEVDRAGGLVFRYRDPDNYYLVRANALEGNVVPYKVERGKRSDLKPSGSGLFTYGKKTDVPSGQWSVLRVEARGNRFSVSFAGKALFEVEDDTFAGAGKVGLWTKADSVTAFDDLAIESLDGKR
jgi:hypothetical protein